jgi:hypothetical protein
MHHQQRQNLVPLDTIALVDVYAVPPVMIMYHPVVVIRAFLAVGMLSLGLG